MRIGLAFAISRPDSFPPTRASGAVGQNLECHLRQVMRISVLYSEDAGDGVPIEAVREEIERHGHDLVYAAQDVTAFNRSLETAVDLAVAVGGDGTARRVALALAGTSTPLAILPFGTANNIASSLRLTGTLGELVARWSTGAR